MQQFSEFLEREAGQLMFSFILLLTGWGMALSGMDYGREIMVASSTLIARAMFGNGNGSKVKGPNGSS